VRHDHRLQLRRQLPGDRVRITADYFGNRNVGTNFPLVFLAYGVGGVVGPILGGVAGDNQAWVWASSPPASPASSRPSSPGAGAAAAPEQPSPIAQAERTAGAKDVEAGATARA
jgi:MFS family permease